MWSWSLLVHWLFYTVSQKMHQLWNGIVQNYKDQFWWLWQKYSKCSTIEYVCFSFHVRLLVITLSSLELHTKNNACMLCASVSCSARLCLQHLRHRSLWIIHLSLLNISAKRHPYNFKIGAFFETQCIKNTTCWCRVKKSLAHYDDNFYLVLLLLLRKSHLLQLGAFLDHPVLSGLLVAGLNHVNYKKTQDKRSE